MPTSCFLFISLVRLLIIFFKKKIIQAENILKLAEKGFSKTVVESVADPRTDHQQKLLESLDGGLCLLLFFLLLPVQICVGMFFNLFTCQWLYTDNGSICCWFVEQICQ
jgi:hypothetical protein